MHEIKTEKCSDICQHHMKYVLTYAKSDLTLVKICGIIFWLRHLSDPTGIRTGLPQNRKMSDAWLISCSDK